MGSEQDNIDRLEDTVTSHALQLVAVVGKLDMLSDSVSDVKSILKESSSTQKMTSEAIGRIEVLMERQANHEARTQRAFEHIHSRFDEHLKEDKEYHERMDRLSEAHSKKFEKTEGFASNGQTAYSVIKWTLITFGTLLSATLFSMFLQAIKLLG